MNPKQKIASEIKLHFVSTKDNRRKQKLGMKSEAYHLNQKVLNSSTQALNFPHEHLSLKVPNVDCVFDEFVLVQFLHRKFAGQIRC